MSARSLTLLVLLLLAPGLGSAPRLEGSPSSLVYPPFWHTPLGVHRGTPTLLKLMLGGAVRFDDPAGLACAGMLERGGSPEISVFGVNRGSAQVIYNPSLHGLAAFGGPGSGEGRFLAPAGIACNAEGRVAVADSGNHRIALLRFEGRRLRWEGSLGRRGAGPGEFEAPEGVALDSRGRIWVADTGNDRVQVFDAQGRFLAVFGEAAGQANALLAPSALAVVDPGEPWSARPEGALWVIDAGGERLQKFTLGGDWRAQALAADLGRPSLRLHSLALDYRNNAWVTDQASDQVHKLDAHLRLLDSWGGPGRGDGRLDSPRGIAIHRRYGQVVVLEKDSAQYLWIGADLAGLQEAPPGPKGGRRFDFRLSEPARLDAWVEDAGGRRLATLLQAAERPQGEQSLRWDGRAEGGAALPAGCSLVLRAQALYASAGHVSKERRLPLPSP